MYCSAEVYAIAVIGEKVCAGGDFDTAGGITVNNLACWDAQSGWSAVGEGVRGTAPKVKTLAVDSAHEFLYVGGSFETPNSTAAKNFAIWNLNNESWESVTGGVDGGKSVIHAMLLHEDYLYVGGDFTSAGTAPYHTNFAVWNTRTRDWIHEGDLYRSTTDAPVTALAFTAGSLYIGGAFKEIANAGGMVKANAIAKWDTQRNAWVPLGSGSDTDIASMASDSQYLYVGGGFSLAGGKSSHRFGRWMLPDRTGTLATTTTLTATATTLNEGESVTFTALIEFQGASIPDDSITFYVDAKAIITVYLSENSVVATWTTNELTAGAHTITARYNGDTNYAASTSAPISLTVNSAYKVFLPTTIR